MHKCWHGWEGRGQAHSSGPTCAGTWSISWSFYFFSYIYIYFYFFSKHVDLPSGKRQAQLGGGGCQMLLSHRLRNWDTWIIYARQFVWQIIVAAVTYIVLYIIFSSHLCFNQTCLRMTLTALLVTMAAWIPSFSICTQQEGPFSLLKQPHFACRFLPSATSRWVWSHHLLVHLLAVVYDIQPNMDPATI